MTKKNKTGYLGVSRSNGKAPAYRARLWNPGSKELLYLGTFQTPEQAAEAVERVQRLREKRGHVPYRKSACKWGHIFQPHTSYTFTRKGSNKVYRRCLICLREYQREYNRTQRKELTKEQREARRAYGREWMRRKRAEEKAKRQAEQNRDTV